MKYIYYIGYVPLTAKIKEDLYINKLLNQNYIVYYLDFASIFFNNLNVSETQNEKYVIRIHSYREMENVLSSIPIKDTLFISTITFEYRTLRLYKILTNYHVKLAFLARGMIPIASMETPLFYRFIKNPFFFLKGDKLTRFGKNQISFLFRYFGIVKSYDIIFMAGAQGFFTIGVGKKIDIKKAYIVNINYFDYDKYLDIRNDDEILVNERYCVFIDQYLPYHPDVKMFFKQGISPNQYYKLLNGFFDNIEMKLGVKVVIAAHPKSEYEINPFNGRLLIKHKTAELVKNAEIVFTHNSTSVSYGILFNKPICVLASSALEKLFGKGSIELFAHRFGGVVVNLDEFRIDDFEVPFIDDNKYELYKHEFLTSRASENDQTINIFLKALEEI